MLNNVCFLLQINPSVITDSWNDFSPALQIKIFNHPVSISFCFAVIAPAPPTSWCYAIHPSSLEPLAAGLGASRVSSYSKKKQQLKKNLLTWEFEVLVVAKLWNKESELRGGSLCFPRSAWINTLNLSELRQSVQSTETWTPGDGQCCPRSPVNPQTWDVSGSSRTYCTSYLMEMDRFSILTRLKAEMTQQTSGLGTSIARCWLVAGLDLSYCRWAEIINLMLKPEKNATTVPSISGYFTPTLEVFPTNYPNEEIYGVVNLSFGSFIFAHSRPQHLPLICVRVCVHIAAVFAAPEWIGVVILRRNAFIL